jgi:hypothetical protein
MDTFIVGPLEDVPPALEVTNHETSVSPGDAAVINFLDNMLASHGKQSVIYVCPSGSCSGIFSSYLSSLLERYGVPRIRRNYVRLSRRSLHQVLRCCGVMLLHSRSYPRSSQTSSPVHRTRIMPIGCPSSRFSATQLLAGTSPTAGGTVHRKPSVCESQRKRIGSSLSPILLCCRIIWPFGGDQPTNAALLSLKHRAAFELICVKTGPGARQPYHLTGQDPVDFSVDGVRREVRELLVKLRGEEGKEVRKNADALGAAMEKSWTEGGEAISQTNAFLAKYVRSS